MSTRARIALAASLLTPLLTSSAQPALATPTQVRSPQATQPLAPQPQAPPPRATNPGAPLRGVTAETVRDLDALVAAVRAHGARPSVRIVFQRGEPPAAYRTAIRRLSPHADIVGLLLDSTAMRATTVAQVRERARAYVREFADEVDIWEIGNELNGEWLGTPASINAKVAAAYDVVEVENAALGLRSAITLNYWPSDDCYAQDWEATLPFARQLPERVRRGSDYVLLSFHETACSPRAHPSAADFTRVLRALGTIAPQARLGIGAQGKADGLPANPTLAEKQRIARTYYGMHPQLRTALGPRFVGGYCWWYYATDAVPKNRPGSLWPTIDALLGAIRS